MVPTRRVLTRCPRAGRRPAEACSRVHGRLTRQHANLSSSLERPLRVDVRALLAVGMLLKAAPVVVVV
jgi:hypothetical protein